MGIDLPLLLWRIQRAVRIVLPAVVLVDFVHSCIYVKQLYAQRLEDWDREEREAAELACRHVLANVVRACHHKEAALWPFAPSVLVLRTHHSSSSGEAVAVRSAAAATQAAPHEEGARERAQAARGASGSPQAAAAAVLASNIDAGGQQQRQHQQNEVQKGEDEGGGEGLWRDMLGDLADTLRLEPTSTAWGGFHEAAASTAFAVGTASLSTQQQQPPAAASPSPASSRAAAAGAAAAVGSPTGGGSSKPQAAAKAAARARAENEEGGEDLPESLYWKAARYLMSRYDLHPAAAFHDFKHRQKARAWGALAAGEARLRGAAEAWRAPHVAMGRVSALRFRWDVRARAPTSVSASPSSPSASGDGAEEGDMGDAATPGSGGGDRLAADVEACGRAWEAAAQQRSSGGAQRWRWMQRWWGQQQPVEQFLGQLRPEESLRLDL